MRAELTDWSLVMTSLLPTCSTLDDDNKFNSVSFEERPPALLVVMSVTEVPTRRVQQAEVVSWDQTELVTLTPMARMRG